MDVRTPPKLTSEQAARFKRLAWPHLAMVLRMARHLTRHDQQAEDLAQETMMKAMRAIDSYQEGTDIKAWLMTILRRAHIDALRSNQRHAHTLSLEQVEMEPAQVASEQAGAFDDKWSDPAALLDRFGDQEIIDALGELPEEIRWTLLLVDVEQMDQADAATILQVPVGTIKSRAHRGRAMLRDRLFIWAQERGWAPRQESSHA